MSSGMKWTTRQATGKQRFQSSSCSFTSVRPRKLVTGIAVAVCALIAQDRLELKPLFAKQATTSVADGDWHDASTWSNGVPTANTKVTVAENTTVNLGGRNHVADEIIVHGTLNVPEGLTQSNLIRNNTINQTRRGVAISDSATGNGFLMYSRQNVQGRFSLNRNWNSNVVAVRFQGNQWQFNNNSQWVDFTPDSNDQLLAEFDFDSDTVVSLQGQRSSFEGVKLGFLIGDLSFEPNQFNGRFNIGEVFVGGSSFVTATRNGFQGRVIRNPANGVLVADSVRGEGYLMYTAETTQNRFGSARNVNSNVVAVRNSDGQWQGFGNGQWVDFRRRNTDRLIAAVDFSTDQIVSLRGTTSVINNIQAGFVAGNVTFGGVNGNRFIVNGRNLVTGRFVRETSTRLNIDKTLRARFIHVNGAGVFRIGSPETRYDSGTFTLTLTGILPDADHAIPMANGETIDLENYDGFVIAEKGGQLQFYGEDRLSFTKLAATAEAGSNSITVANVIERNFDGTLSAASDGQMSFQVGDEVVIGSSTVDYSEEDVRVVVSVASGGGETVLGLDRPLEFRHYGEIESYGNASAPRTIPRNETLEIDLRAEVALLSRNVVIKGLDSQDTDIEFGDRALLETSGSGRSVTTTNGIGGHIIVFGSAGRSRVDGVQLDQMGQAGRSGRYPIHWYLGGDRDGDYIRNSSITNSNNRGVVVHGTDNLLVEGVALHDIHGHGFFTQSGVEVGNRFISNIAFGIHRVGTTLMRNDPFIVDVHDLTNNARSQFESSTAYWITSADNIYVGNISAGAEGSGFWFAPVAEAERPPTAEDFAKGPPELVDIYNRDPLALKIGVFENNTSHSAALGLVFAEIVQTGFRDNRDNVNRLFGGDPEVLGDTGLIKDFTVFKTSTGFYSRIHEAFVNFENYRAADNQISFWDTVPTNINNGLFVGHSRGNSQVIGRNAPVAFFKYFDQLTLSDLHFANFGVSKHGVTPFLFRHGGNRNRFGSSAARFSFEDARTAGTVASIQGGSPRVPTVRPLLDLDGSLTGHLGGGAGYSVARTIDFWFDGQDGDRVVSTSGREAAITRKEFAGFHLISSGLAGSRPNVRLRITSPGGVAYEFGGTVADEPTNTAGNRPFINDPRALTVANEEYSIEPVRPYDLANNSFQFAYFDWGSPENTVTNTFRFVGGASQLTPVYTHTGEEVRSVTSLRQLRAATSNTYFRSSNGDLYLKLFNATADTPGALERDVFTMIPR